MTSPTKERKVRTDRPITQEQIEAGLRELALSHDPYDSISSLTDSDLVAVYIAMHDAISRNPDG